jgi:hypothetical protein
MEKMPSNNQKRLAIIEYLTKKENEGDYKIHPYNGCKYIIKKRYMDDGKFKKKNAAFINIFAELNIILSIDDERLLIQDVGNGVFKIKSTIYGFGFDDIQRIINSIGYRNQDRRGVLYANNALIIINDYLIPLLKTIREIVEESRSLI